jgi:hypothetical protein
VERPQEKAVELLVHYFEQAGVTPTSDMRSEMYELVSLIIEAAMDRIEELKNA